jgi:hypothetical protein
LAILSLYQDVTWFEDIPDIIRRYLSPPEEVISSCISVAVLELDVAEEERNLFAGFRI